VQSVGGVPAATFTTTSTGGYLQDVWSPFRGLSILFGLRLELESWPTGGVELDTVWARRTLLVNFWVPKAKARLDPRFAVTWSAGPRREWLLRAEAGMYAEAVDPALLAEVRTHDGTAEVRRGLGSLGAWPAVPDSVAAPVTGRVLTLLQRDFAAPRTSRAGLGVAHSLGGVSLQVAGQYRHTDRLARRSDLNLSGSAGLQDQFGRPVHGELTQYGSLLAAVPGSNRRFSDYDRVWALEPTGYSDYWGLTASMERARQEGLSFWASYTYSETTDNWPGAAGSVPETQLSPFPDRTQGDWRDGRSDLDVPHRASLGAEWGVGGVRVGALVRVRSGLPFTPGFRDGVDANGDGAWGNDPAFVSDTVSGAADVIAGSSCLRGRIGRFAERNSCRSQAVASLDARLSVRVFTLLGAPVEVVVDGLNLVSTDDGVVDRALYLVDATRAVSTSGGVVNVPLVANPNFGKLLVRRSPGSAVRAGLRVNF